MPKKNKTGKDKAYTPRVILKDSRNKMKKNKITGDKKNVARFNMDLRNLIDLTSYPAMIVDKETKSILEANKASNEFYGFTRRELLKKHLNDLIAHDKKMKSIGKGSVYHQNKNGEILEVKVSSKSINIGKKKYLLVTIQSAANRKAGKEDILHNTFFKDFIDTNPGSICLKDSGGKYVFVNNQWANLFGLEKKHVIGKTVSEIWSNINDAEIIEQEDKSILAGEVDFIEKEEKVITPSGKTKWYYLVKKLVLNKNDSTKYVATIGVDITKQKIVEKEIIENEKNYRYLIESNIEAMSVFQDMRHVMVNSAWEKLFGYSQQEAVSSKFNISNLIAPESKKNVENKIKNYEQGKPFGSRYAFSALNKEGKKLELEVSITGILWSGRPAILCTLRDISIQKRTEEALKREAFIFDNLYDAIIISDLEGNILNWNDSATRMYGYKKEDVINLSSSILNPKEIGTKITPQIIAEVERSGKWTGEIEFIKKDGTHRISETFVFPFKDNRGETIALVGVNRDITERKKSEEELKESRRKYKELTDLLPQTIFEINLEGKYTFVNKAGFSTFNYSPEDFENGLVVYDLIVPKDRGRAAANILKVLKGEKVGETEYQVIKKDGTVFPALIFSSPVIREGVTVGLRGILIDITERKQIEDQLLKLSRAVEQNPSSIMITDLFGDIEYVNPRFTELTGYSKQDVLGKNPRLLKSGETSRTVYEDLWNTITKGNTWRGEFHNRKKSGDLYWEFVSISPIVNQDGKISHFLAIKEDITQKRLIEKELLRAKERAEESDRLKSEFLAQMSHEIRSPLNIIMSYNSLLKEELASVITDEQNVALSSIDSAGKRLLRTIDLILNMAALQSGYIDVKPMNVDLVEILKSLAKEFDYSASNKNLKLLFTNKVEAGVILGDEYIVSEIFENLIGNAIKYTSQGTIEIILYENAEKKLCVDIQDTGIGISKDYLPKLFSPFSQEESGYSRRFEGNGLGLALVEKYVDLLGARIKVESQKGVGTIFTVIFKRN